MSVTNQEQAKLNSEIKEGLNKLGVSEIVNLSRLELEALFARHFDPEFIHISSVDGNPDTAEIIAIVEPKDFPKFFDGHHPNGKLIAPGNAIPEMVNQALGAFFLKNNPKLGFYSKGYKDVDFKRPITSGTSVYVEIKITKIQNLRFQQTEVTAEAKISTIDEKSVKKLAATATIMGISYTSLGK